MPFADPYCARIGEHVRATEPEVVGGGTMVVIEGPRFSTRAESQHFAAQGWSLVNMTGHPEAVLARELGLCYATLALVTDLDAGIEVGEGVGQAEVFAMFERNVERLKALLTRVICGCPTLPDAPVPPGWTGSSCPSHCPEAGYRSRVISTSTNMLLVPPPEKMPLSGFTSA